MSLVFASKNVPALFWGRSLLNKKQQAKDAAASVIDQIDAMKKSILAKAFHGELGTNAPPGEESAVELLKKVLAE